MTDIRDAQADRAVRDGLELVGLVRDYGVDTIEEFLDKRTRIGLEALVVALASMVPDDKPVSELLAWRAPSVACQGCGKLQVRRPGQMGPIPKRCESCGPRCKTGSHLSYNRHRARGENPCQTCVEAERTYQRERKRKQRTGQTEPRQIKPCGTHSAYNRHKAAGEQPCEVCVEAERLYQRLRHLEQKGRAA